MFRARYHYNPETCQYERVKVRPWQVVRTLGLYALAGLAMAGIFFLILQYTHHDSGAQQIANETQDLESDYSDLSGKVDSLGAQLSALQQVDREVHTTMMGAAPMDTTAEDSLPVGDVQDRLEQLTAEMEAQKASYGAIMGALGNADLGSLPCIRPVPGEVLSGFGNRKNPILNAARFHPGIDLQAPAGTLVVATADGTVEIAGTGQNGYGMYVEIRHQGGFVTRYAHLESLRVQPGARVKRGAVIGKSGSTGLSKGPHLHYEILRNGKNVDPVDYFYADLDPTAYVAYKKQAALPNASMD